MADDDPRLVEARAHSIGQIADMLQIGGLKRAGRERIGPCPACGGRDRFSINPDLGVFNCRGGCGGGDGLKLIQIVKGCDFRAALDWLVGGADVGLSDDELQARARQAEADRARREAEAARRRRAAIDQARAIWDRALPAAGTVVGDYLRRRGLPGRLAAAPPPCLRFAPDLRYMAPGAGPHEMRELHRGPAMIAAIQGPRGGLIGVHRTWLDLDQPGGKARIRDGEADLPAKKVWGSMKGGAIRLSHPDGVGLSVLVMAEGIETTLTAMAAGHPPGAGYWAGISLGNMAGRRKLGEGMKYAGVPDLDDPDAFVPPAGVEWLIYVQDGDSDPRLTRAKLEAGLRRAAAARPGRRISIVHAGEGRDLNDVVMEANG